MQTESSEMTKLFSPHMTILSTDEACHTLRTASDKPDLFSDYTLEGQFYSDDNLYKMAIVDEAACSPCNDGDVQWSLISPCSNASSECTQSMHTDSSESPSKQKYTWDEVSNNNHRTGIADAEDESSDDLDTSSERSSMEPLESNVQDFMLMPITMPDAAEPLAISDAPEVYAECDKVMEHLAAQNSNFAEMCSRDAIESQQDSSTDEERNMNEDASDGFSSDDEDYIDTTSSGTSRCTSWKKNISLPGRLSVKNLQDVMRMPKYNIRELRVRSESAPMNKWRSAIRSELPSVESIGVMKQKAVAYASKATGYLQSASQVAKSMKGST